MQLYLAVDELLPAEVLAGASTTPVARISVTAAFADASPCSTVDAVHDLSERKVPLDVIAWSKAFIACSPALRRPALSGALRATSIACHASSACAAICAVAA